ncbi:LPS export ABC transporter permease LptF [Profundibacter amoris]|uniref:LPS export ABC transporter permease LptF n=1 Tax=Profundibacter amoris TaxID=2171755 RepID=A0A347UGZ3_9RHOB|nr:LPS export ABC transporter permease LptF [Profundibacter amoris]AXX98121.1 LPS export ABC transporter permease LptF [Profundibacter amoris]
MARFDRYLLSQLMVFFGFFALVLVMVYWVNRAVLLFDQLIADGQSATVFLEFTALTLPNVIRIVLPVAAFAGSVYATNRLSSESELVVVQAMGFSGFRLARPVLVFGMIVALLTGILSHILVPISAGLLAERSAEIRENITARFLTEGEFLHPTDGITFYIREISPQGELLDVFMSDSRNPDSQVIYTAKNAFLVREETGPKLVMFDGMAQTLDTKENRLFTTRFSDFSYDIGALINVGKQDRRSVGELSTRELLWPTEELAKEVKTSRAYLLYSGHERFAQPLLAVVTALIGFATLLIGNYSRFGVMRQILAAIVILVLIKALDSTMVQLAQRDVKLWGLVYVPVLVGLSISALLLWLSERPGRLKRMFTRRRGATA